MKEKKNKKEKIENYIGNIYKANCTRVTSYICGNDQKSNNKWNERS